MIWVQSFGRIKFSMHSATHQEVMLKKGLAWHYTAYDQREEFSKVNRQIFLILHLNPQLSCLLKRTESFLFGTCPVGKGCTRKAYRLVGVAEPRKAMGVEERQTRRQIMLLVIKKSPALLFVQLLYMLYKHIFILSPRFIRYKSIAFCKKNLPHYIRAWQSKAHDVISLKTSLLHSSRNY